MGIKCPKCKVENPETATFCADCGSKLPSPADIEVTETMEAPKKELTTGSTFAGRYQIIEELGKGGMGEVYKVRDVKLDEEMALKVLKPDIASEVSTIERFRNELKLARKITHRNVCRMHDFHEEEGTPYITMEYVKGEDLKTFIRRKEKLKEQEVIALAKQVCEGLAEAHELGVVHRDLKPQNIMIDEKSNAKVMDFGIARSVEAPGVTQSGVMIGTPDYMSPEQAEGEEADQRSDIYAMGIILYEMVTGSVPFKGDTAFSVALKHKSKLPSDPKKLNPDVSIDLSRLILICMEKERKRRYQTAEALLADLRNIEDGLPLGSKIRPRRKTFAAALIRKKLFIPAAVVALAIIAIIIWQLLPRRESVPIPSFKHSVAVLPFEDLSPEQDQAYFCDGIAAELINRLTKIEKLKVPARASSFSFKDKALDIQEIGEKLKVESLLVGSLQKAENRLRITVELVKVSDGYPLWSEKYERNMDDIFALQDEISLAIVDKLKIKLLGEEKTELVIRHTQNPEAYNSFLRGRYFWNKRTPESMEISLEHFQKAIEKDPEYALAYAGLADSYITLGAWIIMPPKEAFPRAKEAAVKALEIDNSLAEAHNALAYVKFIFDWDWEEAEKTFERAIALNPRYATAHQFYGEYLTAMGRFDEALRESRRAQELDPLSLIINAISGWPFLYKREYDRAIDHFKKALNMDPHFRPALIYLGRAYFFKGMYNEALAKFKITNNILEIGQVYAKMGNTQEAKRVLEDIKTRHQSSHGLSIPIAVLYLYLGDNDQFFIWLEKAYEERNYYMAYINVDPKYDSIRSDPRFTVLLQKMNLDN
jgi:serine/threonine protein kinase